MTDFNVALAILAVGIISILIAIYMWNDDCTED